METSSRRSEAVCNAFPGNEVFGGFDFAVRPKPGELFQLGLILSKFNFEVAHFACPIGSASEGSRERRRVEAKQNSLGNERFKRQGQDANAAAASKAGPGGADVGRPSGIPI